MKLLFFHPLYKERVWGGRALEQVLGRRLPGDQPIGESWDLVDRQADQSVVRSGKFAGLTLRHLLQRQAEQLMGPGWAEDRPFPVLVKWLDCRERLSLQVHPPASIAASLGGEPKAENWFVAHAAPESSLIVGLKRDTSRSDFEQQLRDGDVEPLLHRFPVQAGSSILVESGRLHAIDAGNLILEIQQNSDTTYRVYDWGRLGLDGRPRDLHLKESMLSIDFEDFEPSPLLSSGEPGETVLADCAEFRIRRINLQAGQSTSLSSKDGPLLIHGVSGKIAADSGDEITPGDTALLPFAEKIDWLAKESVTLLVTDHFNKP